MKRLRWLKMVLLSECYCFEKEGDNPRCPKHGTQGRIVRWIAMSALVAIFVAISFLFALMPGL